MNDSILFREKQRFNQAWLWLLMLVINGIFLYACYLQLIVNQKFGDHSMSNNMLIFTFIVIVLFTVLMRILYLDTLIGENGIYVRFSPLQRKYKHYSWNVIETAYIRQYSPILEYGGWGIKYGKSGWAYNVQGKSGIQLILNDHSKVLIGTQKMKEVKELLNRFKS